MPRPLLVAACTALVSATVLSGCSEPNRTPSRPGRVVGTAGVADIRAELDELAVAGPRSMRGYSRGRFPHWSSQGDGCDTRDEVLKRDGTEVRTGEDCKILSGHWYSPYDGKTLTSARQVDIDHTVPLANAWRSGADAWDDARREAFANDLTRPQLLAVSASSNRAKGDQDPAQWRPAVRDYWCEYAQRWVTVKSYWRLSVTERERAKLAEMLETCQ